VKLITGSHDEAVSSGGLDSDVRYLTAFAGKADISPRFGEQDGRVRDGVGRHGVMKPVG
jgi:hypothetical protein